MNYTSSIYNCLDSEQKSYIESLKEILEKKMPADLFAHSCGTMDFSARLADRYHDLLRQEVCAESKVRKDFTSHSLRMRFYKLLVAGMLHDYAKIYDDGTLAAIAKQHGTALSDFEISCRPIIHGYIGPFLIQRDFGIYDSDIENSIRSHTTGSLRMGVADRILYIADKLEPTRDYRGVRKLRKLSMKSLDLCLLEVYKSNIIYVIMRNHALHPDTSKIWNYICGGLKNAI